MIAALSQRIFSLSRNGNGTAERRLLRKPAELRRLVRSVGLIVVSQHLRLVMRSHDSRQVSLSAAPTHVGSQRYTGTTALTTWALAKMNIRAVRPIFVVTVQASQTINVLQVVGTMCRGPLNDPLHSAIHETNLRSFFVHFSILLLYDCASPSTILEQRGGMFTFASRHTPHATCPGYRDD